MSRRSEKLVSRVAQVAFDRLLHADPVWFGARVTRRASAGLRRVLAESVDPVVTYFLDGKPLLIPLSHELPFYRIRHPDYGMSFGRITALVASRYPSACVIDIGANVGDTATLVRLRARVPMLCIEGDPVFYHLLESNLGSEPDVTIVRALLDETTGSIIGKLISGRGTARIATSDVGVQVPVQSLPDLLESFPQFKEPKVIKVDTDGMDGRIIRGSMPVIARAKPVLFFEYDPDLAAAFRSDLRGLIEELAGAGYEHALVYENTGDYLYSLKLADRDQVEDFHESFSGHRGRRYADLCVFHESDTGLWRFVRQSEMTYFRARRSAAGGDA